MGIRWSIRASVFSSSSAGSSPHQNDHQLLNSPTSHRTLPPFHERGRLYADIQRSVPMLLSIAPGPCQFLASEIWEQQPPVSSERKHLQADEERGKPPGSVMARSPDRATRQETLVAGLARSGDRATTGHQGGGIVPRDFCCDGARRLLQFFSIQIQPPLFKARGTFFRIRSAWNRNSSVEKSRIRNAELY